MKKNSTYVIDKILKTELISTLIKINKTKLISIE